MEKTAAPKSRAINNSLSEALFFISIILMPAFVLVSFQAFTENALYIFTSAFLGLAFGFVALMLCCFLVPSALKGNLIIKTIALFSPAVLLLSFIIDPQVSTIFYSIFFIVFFILLYFGFIFPVKDRGKHICASLILLSMLFAIEYSLFVYDLFSPDSFSYYDISNTIFSDFYSVATQRQYIVDTQLGISFPYLYPTMIAMVNTLTGLKIYSGTILNIVFTCISCLLLYKISTKHFKNPYAGTIAAAFMVTNDPYLTEMRVARSVPLAVLSILVLTYYIFDLPKLSTKACILAGVGAGTAMVCRFDAFVAAGLCFLVIFIFSQKGSHIKNSLKYIIGLLIPTLPWIVFSLVNFGTPWISDNGGTMWMAVPSIPQRYYSSTYTIPTIFNNFSEWFARLFDYKLKYVWEYGISKCLPLAFLIIFLVWAAVMLIRFIRCRQFKKYVKAQKKLLISAGICVLVYFAKFCGIWIVGFSDARYHSESFIMLTLFISAVIYSISAFSKVESAAEENAQRKKKNRTAIVPEYAENYEKTSKSIIVNAVTALACTAFIVAAIVSYSYLDRYTPAIMSDAYLTKPDSVKQIENVVTSKKDNPRVFYSGVNEGDPFSFGAYTGIKTFGPPWAKADDPNALIEITDNYVMPDYVVCKSDTLRADFAQRYGLVAVYDYYNYYTVYEVTNKTTFAAEQKLFPYAED